MKKFLISTSILLIITTGTLVYFNRDSVPVYMLQDSITRKSSIGFELVSSSTGEPIKDGKIKLFIKEDADVNDENWSLVATANADQSGYVLFKNLTPNKDNSYIVFADDSVETEPCGIKTHGYDTATKDNILLPKPGHYDSVLIQLNPVPVNTNFVSC